MNIDRMLDVNKHMTTLSAGAVVLISTFMKDIFPKENGELAITFWPKTMLAMSLLGFAFSILMSLTVMLSAAFASDEQALSDAKSRTIAVVLSFMLGVYGFAFVVYITTLYK